MVDFAPKHPIDSIAEPDPGELAKMVAEDLDVVVMKNPQSGTPVIKTFLIEYHWDVSHSTAKRAKDLLVSMLPPEAL